MLDQVLPESAPQSAPQLLQPLRPVEVGGRIELSDIAFKLWCRKDSRQRVLGERGIIRFANVLGERFIADRLLLFGYLMAHYMLDDFNASLINSRPKVLFGAILGRQWKITEVEYFN